MKKLGVGILLAGSLVYGGAANAAEIGKSVYLLGSTTSMAGMMPPSGFYYAGLGYFYHAKGSGAAALSRTLGHESGKLPSFPTLKADADLTVKADVAIKVSSLLWVSPTPVLGGKVGFGVLVPVGYQTTDVNVTARAAITFPGGSILGPGQTRRVTDDTFAIGDPLATAFIGWNSGHYHWKLTGLVNIPVGSYSRTSLVNMGFNRWAADLTGSMTYLNPQNGFEVSVSPGITFNGENPSTNYRTGTEFHVEAAIMQHFSPKFSVGIVGYHYQQLTGDSGSGAVLGGFKGRVSAIGPSINYTFEVGDYPVVTSLRWMREFNTKNRLEGDAAIFTLTIPLGGKAQLKAH
ncbi:MAG: transporter [Methylobacterium sp.]|nr:transporter [Methylobacterium sp.]MCA3625495.1 transporter [Methylobacterium sp.]